MIKPDLINSLFELAGAILACMNIKTLLKDKVVKGVYWPATAVFALWGYWNIYYYPTLNQPLSFYAGILLALANTTWVILAFRYNVAPKLFALPIAPAKDAIWRSKITGYDVRISHIDDNGIWFQFSCEYAHESPPHRVLNYRDFLKTFKPI